MTRRTTASAIACAIGMLGLHPALARAQADSARAAAPVIAIDTAVQRQIARARSLVESGDGARARALLDSLVSTQGVGTEELGETLYWRAVLGESASEAERDWKRLVLDVPLAARAAEALLWLAELELVRGHPDVARSHLERLLRDHGTSPQRTKALLWIARSHFDEREPARACPLVSSVVAGGLPEGELRLQAQELRNRCDAYAAQQASGTATSSAGATTAATPPDSAARDTVRDTPRDTTRPAAVRARYTVQLGAFPTRAEADRAVRRLGTRGVQARVDGTRRPFRVRTGRYATRADATAALAALKKKGHTGFVAELPR